MTEDSKVYYRTFEDGNFFYELSEFAAQGFEELTSELERHQRAMRVVSKHNGKLIKDRHTKEIS